MTKEQIDEFLFDNRIAHRHIRDGRLNRADFEKYLASLPDLKDQCENIGEEIYRSKKPGLALMGEFSSSEQDEE